jgi:DtxR family transcriptional regulator, manganese transport regulator
MAQAAKDKSAYLDRRAAAFARVRAAHQTETAEDYVEMIADLIEIEGEARAIDLARYFGVSHATVSKIVLRLGKEGYVTSRPYRSLFLTEKGEALARQCRKRHAVVHDFLRALRIPEDIAHLDAEGIEHHVSAETLQAFARLTRKLNREK